MVKNKFMELTFQKAIVAKLNYQNVHVFGEVDLKYFKQKFKFIINSIQVPGLRSADISAHIKRVQEAAKAHSNSRVSGFKRNNFCVKYLSLPFQTDPIL